MQNIHDILSDIEIKDQKVNPEVLAKVYNYATENAPKRRFMPKVKRFAWVAVVAAAAVVALVVSTLPQRTRDLTYANIGYYTIDINPSVSIHTDGLKNVIGIEGLNEDGKGLVNTLDCVGLPIDEALEMVLKAAKDAGYLDGKNVVIGYFGDGSSGISMDKVSEYAGLGKAVLLIGTRSQYEDFMSEGLSPGLELLELEGEKLGLDGGSPFSDIVAALIEASNPATEKPSATPMPSPTFTPEPTEKPTQEATPEPSEDATPTPKPTQKPTPEKTPAPTSEYLSSTISGEVTDSGVRLNWTKITSGAFNGYKVVASKTNPNPKYPDDGYLYYITDSSATTVLVPFSKLDPDTNYYFSITVLYDSARVAGNSVMLKTPEQQISYEGTTLSGGQTETGISLSWTKVNSAWAQGYKVVASATDSTPSYPENGYIEWITNLSDTSRIYCPSGTLQAGQAYWFAITVVYSDGTKITSNAINITMPAPDTPTPEPTDTPTPEPTPSETPTETPSPTPTESESSPPT